MHNRITYKAGATKEIIHCYPREDRKRDVYKRQHLMQGDLQENLDRL